MSLAVLRRTHFLILAASIMLCHVTYASEIFADDFSDNSVDSAKWTTWGTTVAESNAMMQILQNRTDAGGNLKSLPIPINPTAPITITRSTRVHYANSYYMASLHLTFGDLPRVGIRYGNMSYNGIPFQSVFGFFISRNDASPHSRNTDPSDISARIDPIWDTWFTERIVYEPNTGNLQYFINDNLKTTYNVGQMPQVATATLTIQCDSWGWYTGHQHLMDDLRVTQDQVMVSPLPQHIHNPADGRQAVKDLRLTQGGQCAFTFSTDDPGAMCIVSWSGTLKKWFPLIHFNTTAQGTEVLDTPRDPSKFYCTTYLPTGVSAAESFDYPIGSGSVAEQITLERNELYPAADEGTVERPLPTQTRNTAEWSNAQDVGSFLMTSKGPAYHPGEDWNLGLQVDNPEGVTPIDIGQPVRAVADGVVKDISPLNSSSNGGWAVLVRHFLLNGDTIDSIYVHVAPSLKADRTTPNTMGEIGSESWFAYQVDSPVSKGDIIAVVGNVDAYPDHLHFEMRTKPIDNLPLEGDTVAIGRYWKNSLGNAYYQSFDAMEKDGIIDPSDFIDDHR